MNYAQFNSSSNLFDPFSGGSQDPFGFRRFDFHKLHTRGSQLYGVTKPQALGISQALNAPPPTEIKQPIPVSLPKKPTEEKPPEKKPIERTNSGFDLGEEGTVQSIPKTGVPSYQGIVDHRVVFQQSEMTHWDLMKKGVQGDEVDFKSVDFEVDSLPESNVQSPPSQSKSTEVDLLKGESGKKGEIVEAKPFEDYSVPSTYIFSRVFRFLNIQSVIANLVHLRMQKYIDRYDTKIQGWAQKTSFGTEDKVLLNDAVAYLNKIEKQLRKLEEKGQDVSTGLTWLSQRRDALSAVLVQNLLTDYNAADPKRSPVTATELIRQLVTTTATNGRTLWDFFRFVLPKQEASRNPLHVMAAQYLFEKALDLLGSDELSSHILHNIEPEKAPFEDPVAIKIHLLAHFDGVSMYKLFSPDHPTLARLREDIETAYNQKFETDWFTGKADQIVLGFNRDKGSFYLENKDHIELLKQLDTVIEQEVGRVYAKKQTVDFDKFKGILDQFPKAKVASLTIWRVASLALKNNWPSPGDSGTVWGVASLVPYLAARTLEGVFEEGHVPDLSRLVGSFPQMVHTSRRDNFFQGLTDELTGTFGATSLESYVEEKKDLFSQEFKVHAQNINEGTDFIKRFVEVRDSLDKLDDFETWVNDTSIDLLRETNEETFVALERRFCSNVQLLVKALLAKSDAFKNDPMVCQIYYFAQSNNAAMTFAHVKKMLAVDSEGEKGVFCNEVLKYVEQLKSDLNQVVLGDMADQLVPFFSKESFDKSFELGNGDKEVLQAAYEAVKDLNINAMVRTTSGLNELKRILQEVVSKFEKQKKDVRAVSRRIRFIDNQLELRGDAWPRRIMDMMLYRDGGRFELLELGLRSIPEDPNSKLGKALLEFAGQQIQGTILGDRTKFLRSPKTEKKALALLQSYISAFKNMEGVPEHVKKGLSDAMEGLYHFRLRQEFENLLIDKLGVVDKSVFGRHFKLNSQEPISETERKYLYRLLSGAARKVGVFSWQQEPENDIQKEIVYGAQLLINHPWENGFSEEGLQQYYQTSKDKVGLNRNIPGLVDLNAIDEGALNLQVEQDTQSINEAANKFLVKEPEYQNERFKLVVENRKAFEQKIMESVGEESTAVELPDEGQQVRVLGSNVKLTPTTKVDTKKLPGVMKDQILDVFRFDFDKFTYWHRDAPLNLEPGDIEEVLIGAGLQTVKGQEFDMPDSVVGKYWVELLNSLAIIAPKNNKFVVLKKIEENDYQQITEKLFEKFLEVQTAMEATAGKLRRLGKNDQEQHTQLKKQLKEQNEWIASLFEVAGLPVKKGQKVGVPNTAFGKVFVGALVDLKLVAFDNGQYELKDDLKIEESRLFLNEVMKTHPASDPSIVVPMMLEKFECGTKAGEVFNEPESEFGKCLYAAVRELGWFRQSTVSLNRNITPKDYPTLLNELKSQMQAKLTDFVKRLMVSSGWLDENDIWVGDLENPVLQAQVIDAFKNGLINFIGDSGLEWRDADQYLRGIFLSMVNLQPGVRVSDVHFGSAAMRIPIPVDNYKLWFKYNPVTQCERTVFMLSGFTDTPLVSRSTTVQLTERKDSSVIKHSTGSVKGRSKSVNSVPATVSEGVKGIEILNFYDPQNPKRMALLNKIIADNKANFTGNILLSILTNPNDWNNGQNLFVQIEVDGQFYTDIMDLDGIIDKLISGTKTMTASIIGIDNDEALLPEISHESGDTHRSNVHNRLFFHGAMYAPVDKKTLEDFEAIDWESYLMDMVSSLKWYQGEMDRMFDGKQHKIFNINFVPGHLRDIKEKALKIKLFIGQALENWPEDEKNQVTPMDILYHVMPVTAAYYHQARQIAAIMTLIRQEEMLNINGKVQLHETALAARFKEKFGIDRKLLKPAYNNRQRENAIIFHQIQKLLRESGKLEYRDLLEQLDPKGELSNAFDKVLRDSRMSDESILFFYSGIGNTPPQLEEVFAGRERKLKFGNKVVDELFWDPKFHGPSLFDFDQHQKPIYSSSLDTEGSLMNSKTLPEAKPLAGTVIALDGKAQSIDGKDKVALEGLNLSYFATKTGKTMMKVYLEKFFQSTTAWERIYKDQLFDNEGAPLFTPRAALSSKSMTQPERNLNVPSIDSVEFVESQLSARPFALRINLAGGVSFVLDDYSPDTRLLLDALNFFGHLDADPTSVQVQKLFGRFVTYSNPLVSQKAVVDKKSKGFRDVIHAAVVGAGVRSIEDVLKERSFIAIEWEWLASLVVSIRSLATQFQTELLQVIVKKSLKEFEMMPAGAIYQLRGLYYDLFLQRKDVVLGQEGHVSRKHFLDNNAGVSNRLVKQELADVRLELGKSVRLNKIVKIDSKDSVEDVFQKVEFLIENGTSLGTSEEDLLVRRFVTLYVLDRYSPTHRDVKLELEKQRDFRELHVQEGETYNYKNLQEAQHLFNEGVQSFARQFDGLEKISPTWTEITQKAGLLGAFKGRKKLLEVDHLVALYDSAVDGEIAKRLLVPEHLKQLRAFLARQIVLHLDQWIDKHPPEEALQIRAAFKALRDRDHSHRMNGTDPVAQAGQIVLDEFDSLPLERMMAIESLAQYMRQEAEGVDIQLPKEIVKMDWNRERGFILEDLYEAFSDQCKVGPLAVFSPKKQMVKMSPVKVTGVNSFAQRRRAVQVVQGYFSDQHNTQKTLEYLESIDWLKNARLDRTAFLQALRDVVKNQVARAKSIDALMQVVAKLNALVKALNEKANQHKGNQSEKIHLFFVSNWNARTLIETRILAKAVLPKFQSFMTSIDQQAKEGKRGLKGSLDYLAFMPEEVKSVFLVFLYDMDVVSEQVYFYTEYANWNKAISGENWKTVGKQFYQRFYDKGNESSIIGGNPTALNLEGKGFLKEQESSVRNRVKLYFGQDGKVKDTYTNPPEQTDPVAVTKEMIRALMKDTMDIVTYYMNEKFPNFWENKNNSIAVSQFLYNFGQKKFKKGHVTIGVDTIDQFAPKYGNINKRLQVN